MTKATKQSRQDTDWNVLTYHWLEVMKLNAEAWLCSPLEALKRAREIRCITTASSLDLFAAHRFLLTLLYWKADIAGGQQKVRNALLTGEVPRCLLQAIEQEEARFRLFDDCKPFLQDPSAGDQTDKSAGSLFAEFACGTNIAHFHHGDDKQMRLCLGCATIGMLRVIPWTQSGGAGLSPSVHNAPPLMAMASGNNLATTLGWNFVVLSGKAGEAKWTGHFMPTDKHAAIPYLEALTWNPRRVHLLALPAGNLCWRCGQRGVVAVGPIVYLKNENTKSNKKGTKTVPFAWQDPSAFYKPDAPYTTIKSYSERLAATGRDLKDSIGQENTPTSAVVTTNVDHRGWLLVIPCTNPANNKTFDHRQLELASLSAEAISSESSAQPSDATLTGIDGWKEPPRADPSQGATRFVQAAARFLTPSDWLALLAAENRKMHESPAAFDVLSGLLWSLRGRNVAGLPSRNVAWLVLKLMAAVPSGMRLPPANGGFCPLQSLPKRQLDECRGDRRARSRYPIAFPWGHRLEAELRKAIDKHLRQRVPNPIDWAGLCHQLNQLLD